MDSSDNRSCSVCCNDFPEAGKQVLCQCGYLACDKCVKRYMMSKVSLPHCMNCKGKFSLSLLNKTYGEVFITGEYRKYRKQNLLDIEKARFPESMNAATKYKNKQDFEIQTKSLFTELKNINRDRDKACKNISRTKNEFKRKHNIYYGHFINYSTYERRIEEEEIGYLLGYREKLQTGIILGHNDRINQLEKVEHNIKSHYNGGNKVSLRYDIKLNDNEQDIIDQSINDKFEISRRMEKGIFTSGETKLFEKLRQQLIPIEKLKNDLLQQKKKLKADIISIGNKNGINCYFNVWNRFEIINNGDTSTSQTTGSKTISQKCQAPECEGFLSEDYTCPLCKSKTCDKCLEHIKNDEHECNPNTVRTVKLIKRDSKNCPGCGISVNKVEGCLQMWCTQCHTTFDYRTGKKVNGRIHNPHFIEWARNQKANVLRRGNQPLTEQERNRLREMECAQELNKIIGADNLPSKYVKQVTELYRLTIQFQEDVVNKTRNDTNQSENLDLRIKYLLKQTNEAKIKQSLITRDNKRNKEIEFIQVYEFMNTMMIQSINSIKKNPTEDNIQLSLTKIESIREYCNTQLKDISDAYRVITSEITDKYILRRVNKNIERTSPTRLSSYDDDSICKALYKSGKKKGQQCGCKAKYPENKPMYCGKHKKLYVNDTQSICKALYKSGKKKGQQCGCKAKYPENKPIYCGRHKKLYVNDQGIYIYIYTQSDKQEMIPK